MDTVGITFPDEFNSSKSTEGMINNISHPLFFSIISFDNLYLAYKSASKGKRNRIEIFKFEQNLIRNLEDLNEELLNGSYRPSPPRTFHINCHGKDRLIEAPAFRDSVVQHAIYQIVYPLFDKTFIYDSYGCRKGKGTIRCADRYQSFMRKCDPNSYFLQMDFKKYYYSIPHDILTNSIKKVIKCDLTVELISYFYSTYNSLEKIGLGIGNLLSQLFGLIYLNIFDHFIKRVLKCKYYVRYVDDSLIVGLTKEQAIKYKNILVDYVDKQLRLSFSKIRIGKLRSGINFCGYRTWPNKRFVRRRSLLTFRRAVRKRKITSIQAILEHSKKTSSYFYMLKQIINNNKIIVKLPRRFKKDLGRIKHKHYRRLQNDIFV